MALGLLLAVLAGCDEAALAPAQPGGTTTEAPAAPSLTRPGAQVVTLEIRNGTDSPIVQLAALDQGRAGPNLLPPGRAIPPGGRFDLPVSPGLLRLSARLQPPGPLTPGRQVLRNLQVPPFPPNPPPRMPVTLR